MKPCILSVLFAISMLLSSTAHSQPCNGINRQLDNERKAVLAPVIANQLQASAVDVLQLFRLGNWSIIHVDTQEADEVFLFYAADPLTSHYTTLWSGAAARNEETQIMNWVITNAPGIPKRLAGCFAWHVTRNRNM
ncbi:conserved exported hypothetical protein [Candidatus Accumulibacter aalborgensis]|uniref:Uncharacterized protein n=1 Tax=Candidatus Accumulibacter aalborgensis TaxID=1860102 RepID=A0A1A8XLP8_9PROT|nr:hypothetical protein [Candidatus Accumulibacter aalborgensis]SBT05596.1 conserved exported hypothetical protein [Candidatus Accumulibacter aalborgensis]